MATATARLRFLRLAPRKARLVADLIRGKHVQEASDILRFSDKRAGRPIDKLLRSAVANAEQAELNVDKLYVKAVFVDGGPVIKRWMPRAMGRATPILKRTSHITVTLEQR